jgi:hypothetical protein
MRKPVTPRRIETQIERLAWSVRDIHRPPMFRPALAYGLWTFARRPFWTPADFAEARGLMLAAANELSHCDEMLDNNT